VLGSAFNSAYSGDIEGRVGGLPAKVAEGAREAPAIALDSARSLGARGGQLTTAAHHAIESGLKAAGLISAGLLAVAAVYTWWRGTSPARATASEADVDADAGALSGAGLTDLGGIAGVGGPGGLDGLDGFVYGHVLVDADGVVDMDTGGDPAARAWPSSDGQPTSTRMVW
jgi:hypothetical protein